jgi:hypothetical protein
LKESEKGWTEMLTNHKMVDLLLSEGRITEFSWWGEKMNLGESEMWF